MIKYKIKHKIVNCEKIESVTSHDLYPPPLSQTVTLFQTPPTPWSVTYFMDCPQVLFFSAPGQEFERSEMNNTESFLLFIG